MQDANGAKAVRISGDGVSRTPALRAPFATETTCSRARLGYVEAGRTLPESLAHAHGSGTWRPRRSSAGPVTHAHGSGTWKRTPLTIRHSPFASPSHSVRHVVLNFYALMRSPIRDLPSTVRHWKRRPRHIAVLVLVAGALITLPSAAFLPQPHAQAASGIAEEWLVGVQPGKAGQVAAARLNTLGQVLAWSPQLGAVRVRFPATLVRGTGIRALQSVRGVTYVEPNSVVHAFRAPNDPLYALRQYGPRVIGAEAAWDTWEPQRSVVAAVVDTGVDYVHPDLAPVLLRTPLGTVVGYNALNGAASALDDAGHGSLCAGIIAAQTNNGVGIAGIAGWNPADATAGPPVRLMPVKVLNSLAQGTQADLASGLVWAADQGAHVINLSLGGPDYSVTVERAVQYAWNRGCVLVAAAGNSASPAPNYPAAYEHVLSVGATDETDALASFSSYGPWVQVAAPGVGIWSTTRGSYTAEDGTSFAAPHVAGAAAVLLSHDPTLTPAAAVALLRSTGDPIHTSHPLAAGAGRINLAGALRRVTATPVLAAVRPVETRLEHGTAGSASVSLTGPAPEGGVRILLSCVPADGLRLPDFVLLPQGARGGAFIMWLPIVPRRLPSRSLPSTGACARVRAYW